MDDEADTERTLLVKIGDTEHPARPFGEEQVMALQMISSVSGRTVIEILAGLVRFAFGEKVRDQVLVQLSGGDFSAKQLIKVLTDVAEAQGRARQAAEQPHPVTLTQNPVSPNPYAAQPRTLDIAGTLPRRDDDMIPATFGNGGQ